VKVFISWSGKSSRLLAEGLQAWLSDVFYDVETWISSRDLDAGSRWADKLSQELESSDFGILCLFPDNWTSPWLLFEAGSLAKSVARGRVVPYCVAFPPEHLDFPLGQFQGVSADEVGTMKLLQSINAARPSPLPSEQLKRLFKKWWPDLQAQMDNMPIVLNNRPDTMDDALLRDVLRLVRQASGEPGVGRGPAAVWTRSRNLYETSDAEISAMTTADLLEFVAHLIDRLSELLSPGEKDLLLGRQAAAEFELQRRLPNVFRPADSRTVTAE
jgi:hypothetical protein